MASTKRIRSKIATHFGSYGWSGGAQREFETFAEKLKWEVTDPFEFNGGATDEDLRRGEAFGADFARYIKGAGNEES
jgi:flavorubredoxin